MQHDWPADTTWVDSAIQQVHSTSDQINYYQQVVDFNEKLLEVELERLKAGKSNSRLVLEKEESYNFV